MRNERILSATEVKHWVVIKVWDKLGGNVLEILRWDGLPWNTRTRFNWYFTYRAALLQVKYPRAFVDLRWGNNGDERSTERILEAKITGKKATITKHKNRLRMEEEQWDSMFPIKEDFFYQQAVEKIAKLESELEFMLRTENQIT